MANRVEMAAERRTITGKKVSQLRRAGVIPAVVYGHHVAATNIQVDERALNQTLARAGMNRLINIQLSGGDGLVALVRDIQRNPISLRVTHVDFQAVSMDEPIETSVPIILEGTAPATETGGTLLQALDSLDIRALPNDLIASVTVDVGVLTDFDAAIHVRDIQTPGQVTVLTDPDALVAKVTPPAVEEEEVAEGEAEAAQPEVISETEAQRRRTERDED